MIPFGSPVLPLEKMTVARSSRVPGCSRPTAFSSAPTGVSQASAKREELLAEARLGGDFLQQQRAAGDLHFDAVEKGLRGEDGLELALADTGGERFLGERVVEVHRHFAQEERGEVDQRAGDGRRQEDADHFLPGPMRAQAAGEKNDLGQRPTEAQVRHPGVRHREAERAAAGALDEGAMKGLHRLAPVRPGLGVQFLNRGAHLEGRRGGGHWFAETDRDRIRDAPRHLPEETALLVAEDAAPHAVETDGNDRRRPRLP